MLNGKTVTNLSSAKENAPFPNHVAIIMDGNRRWAEQRGLPGLEGHRNGLENMRSVISYLGDYQVKYVTIFAFSTENWNRPRDEVAGLLRLLEERIGQEALEFHGKGVKLRHLGSLDGLSHHLRLSISKALEMTKNNTGITLSFAFNYGGRSEILHAVRRLISEGISIPMACPMLTCLFGLAVSYASAIFSSGKQLTVNITSLRCSGLTLTRKRWRRHY